MPNPQNLRPQPRLVVEPVPRERLAGFRALLREWVADEVGRALERSKLSRRAVSRKLGRDMTRTLHQVLAGEGTTVATLGDIAAATGHKLVIRLEPAGAEVDAKWLLQSLRETLVTDGKWVA
jgi:hypothetical protein